MYSDNQSLKDFELRHARERLREEARHVGEDEAGDTDIVAAHLRSEDREGWLLVAIVTGLLALAAVALAFL